MNLGLPETPVGFEVHDVPVPCTCGKTFATADAFYGHLSHCDGETDTTHDGYVRVGIKQPYNFESPKS